MILILSNKWDLTVDFVVAELRKRNRKFLRINTEDLVLGHVKIKLPDFAISMSKNGEILDITNSVKVIWYRRPGKPYDNFNHDQKPTPAIQQFVNDQWFSWFEALQLIPNVKWINHPNANDAMESKPRQLFLASLLGFQIPKTIITNDPKEVHHFAQQNAGKLVAKALYSPLIEEPEQDFFVFTNEIKDTDPMSDEEIRISPSIYQQSLNPKIDYRVTVIGDTVFPVKIEQTNKLNVDWRTEKSELKFSACTLPAEIEFLCKKFVSDNDLAFGAIDIVQYNGEYYFLEINPNGEWGWLQFPHEIPIASALCDYMILHDR